MVSWSPHAAVGWAECQHLETSRKWTVSTLDSYIVVVVVVATDTAALVATFAVAVTHVVVVVAVVAIVSVVFASETSAVVAFSAPAGSAPCRGLRDCTCCLPRVSGDSEEGCRSLAVGEPSGWGIPLQVTAGGPWWWCGWGPWDSPSADVAWQWEGWRPLGDSPPGECGGADDDDDVGGQGVWSQSEPGGRPQGGRGFSPLGGGVAEGVGGSPADVAGLRRICVGGCWGEWLSETHSRLDQKTLARWH